jgi:hypothetical protein
MARAAFRIRPLGAARCHFHLWISVDIGRDRTRRESPAVLRPLAACEVYLVIAHIFRCAKWLFAGGIVAESTVTLPRPAGTP